MTDTCYGNCATLGCFQGDISADHEDDEEQDQDRGDTYNDVSAPRKVIAVKAYARCAIVKAIRCNQQFFFNGVKLRRQKNVPLKMDRRRVPTC